MSIKDEYKILINNQPIIPRYPTSYFPKPTSSDYSNGWLERYFIKMNSTKDSPIIEISSQEYDKFQEFETQTNFGGLYAMCKIKWIISGNIEKVQLTNTQIVEAMEQQFAGISRKLTNRLQFFGDKSK